MLRKFPVLLIVLMSGFLSACADQATETSNSVTYQMASTNPLTATNYAAADQLLSALKGKLIPGQSMIVATVVDINNLDQSSTLGRLISEQLSARFSQAGVQVIEMKFRESVLMQQSQGELMLSRNVKDLANAHDAQAVLVGSYAESRDFVFVTLKVVQPKTDLVLAVDNYTLPKDKEIMSMLLKTR